MDFPKTIRILGQKWNIVETEVINDSLDTLGLCDEETSTIYLKTAMSDETRWQTFLHEYYHAVMAVIPLGGIKDKHHELLVQYFAGATMDLVRNNKELILALADEPDDDDE